MKVLLVTRDYFNAVRTPIFFGFGESLSRLGHKVALVAVPQINMPQCPPETWKGAELYLGPPVKTGFSKVICHFIHNIKTCFKHGRDYDVWVFRDLIFACLAACLLRKIFKKKVVYWLSYPLPDDDIIRSAEARKNKDWKKFLLLFSRGYITKFFLYSITLKVTDHNFIVSDKFREILIESGISGSKMTAFPLGAPPELIEEQMHRPEQTGFSENGFLTLCYLGTMIRQRRMEFFIQVLAKVKESVPNARLLLIGDSNFESDLVRLRKEISGLGLDESVDWAGRLPIHDAWNLAGKTDIGLSALPPSFLFDTSSPTKVVEFLALGVPMVVSPVPDQKKVIEESGGGYCAEYDVDKFAEAVVKLALNADRKNMGKRGQKYILENRTYSVLAKNILESALSKLLTPKASS